MKLDILLILLLALIGALTGLFLGYMAINYYIKATTLVCVEIGCDG